MPFLKTYSGQHIDYRNVTASQIVTDDIAVALSNICRFAGHERGYSAQLTITVPDDTILVLPEEEE